MNAGLESAFHAGRGGGHVAVAARAGPGLDAGRSGVLVGVARRGACGTGSSATMLLLIDNYDSFTYNLVHYLGELGAQAEVYRNDVLTVQDAIALSPSAIV